MGSVNYFTSEYITLAIKPYDTDDFLSDTDFITYCRECNISPDDLPDYINDTINDYYDADAENARAILAIFDFNFFTVSIVPGYYEGLSVKIETNYSFYDDYAEKRDALKETTQLKECLHKLNGVGFHACAPFWVTAYYDYADTEKMIIQAIDEMRTDIKNADTYYTRRIKSA